MLGQELRVRESLAQPSCTHACAVISSCLRHDHHVPYACRVRRARRWYIENEMDGNFEPNAFAAAFPGRPLSGFLANGEIFGELHDLAAKEEGSAAAAGGGEAVPMEAASAGGGGGGEGGGGDEGEGEGEGLSELPVRELKAMLSQAGVGYSDCLEKAELVERCRRERLTRLTGRTGDDGSGVGD